MRIRWTARGLVGVSIGALVVLVTAIGLLAWRVIEQDRQLGRQRVRERLSLAADLAASEVRQRFDATARQLATIAVADAGDADGRLVLSSERTMSTTWVLENIPRQR
jgi:hypothetical protein